MITWEKYKESAKKLNKEVKEDIEEMEELASIVSIVIDKRNELGFSQRDLAAMCGLPQSSIARIEACIVKPNIDTLIKVLKPLGLKISITSV